MKTYALVCPNCGANLDIAESVETFACSYCGSSVKVEHGGGIVSLRLIGDEVRRVREGTDKTAAELAIVRLTKELSVLEDEARKLESELASWNYGARRGQERDWGDGPFAVGVYGVVAIGILWLAIVIGWSPLIWVAVLLCIGVVLLGGGVFMALQKKWSEENQRVEDAEARVLQLKPQVDAKRAQVDDVKRRLEVQRGIVERELA